jgi:hypothetical protein
VREEEFLSAKGPAVSPGFFIPMGCQVDFEPALFMESCSEGGEALRPMGFAS